MKRVMHKIKLKVLFLGLNNNEHKLTIYMEEQSSQVRYLKKSGTNFGKFIVFGKELDDDILLT